MITYKCNGGRLGENISFIYGVLRFCKINNISYDNVYIYKYYTNTPLLINEEKEYVFLNNKEMFANIWNLFKDYKIDVDKYNHINLCCKSDLAQLYDYCKFFDLSPNVIFSNWWSLNLYWVKKDLNFDFKLLHYICRPKKLVKRLLKKYKDILHNSVAIHVRRGDYLALQNKNMLKPDICSKYNYYFDNTKKIRNINDIVYLLKMNISNNKNILIFSDDIQWCKTNFDFYKNVYFIENQKPYEDMILMSLCDEVIENSGSFFSLVAKILSMYNHELL
jgi:hypothetical protein